MSQNITKDDIVKVASLARLQLTTKEVDKFSKEIDSILTYVRILDNVKIDNYLPTNQVTALENVWRDDKIESYGYLPADLLKNIPDQESGYIKVGRVI